MAASETGEQGRLYSIKETSELTDVPSHTLRFWERRMPGFLTPVRTSGGQRRYTEECLERVKKLDYYVNHKGLSLVGAKRRIEEGVDPEIDERRQLAERILSDKRVRQAVDEIADLIRRKILDGF